jgi:glycosyltransferase involved in cell wall biosynthesis
MTRRNPGARIALLIETDGAGGAERMVAQLAMELETRGHSVVVYLPPRGDGWLEQQLRGSQVEVDQFWLNRAFDPGCARELASSFRNRGIDIAHGHEFSMAFYGAWASRLVGIPHVITMHGRGYYADAVRRRVALRAAAMSSGAFVSVSQALARQLSKDLLLPQRKITFIPNGVRLAAVEHSTLRSELGLSEEDQLIVSVGSLYPVKGHCYLVQAVADLSTRFPRLHLAIAGRGQTHDSLRELGDSTGLGPRLHLLGLRADVANVLAAADIFVLPSLAEGLPLAVLEAMLAARPVIASDVGEIGTVLAQGRAGWLVPPANTEALAATIQAVLSDPAESARVALYASRRADAEYRLERMTARYEALYRTLMGGDTLTGLPVVASASAT